MSEKVSVIVPVYNDEKFLDQCVASIVKQSYQNLEIILIDDESTDRSPQICEKWRSQDSRVRVLHKKNAGVGSSRNAGLAMATGKYILFVDDDDMINQKYVAFLHQLLIEHHSDVAACNFNELDEAKHTYIFHLRYHDADYFQKNYSPEEWFKQEYNFKQYMMSVIFTVPWCKLFKRSLFKDIAYPENTKLEDDLTTWKIYLLANQISFANRDLYTHRKLQSSVSTKLAPDELFSIKPVLQRIAILDLIGFDTSEEEKALKIRLRYATGQPEKISDFTEYRNSEQFTHILKHYQIID